MYKKILLILLLSIVSPSADTLKTGDEAPTFFAKTLDRKNFFLSDALKAKKPVVLSFFATWCVPCMYEMPLVDSLASKYPSINVYFVNVGNLTVSGTKQRENPKDVRRLIENLGIKSEVLMDKYAKVAEFYDAITLPRLVMIDSNGAVSYLKTGYDKDSKEDRLEIERQMEKIINEPK